MVLRSLAMIVVSLLAAPVGPRDITGAPCVGGGVMRETGNLTRNADGTITGAVTRTYGNPTNNLADCVLADGRILTGTLYFNYSGPANYPTVTIDGTLALNERGPTGGLVPIPNTSCSVLFHSTFGSSWSTQGQSSLCDQIWPPPPAPTPTPTGGGGDGFNGSYLCSGTATTPLGTTPVSGTLNCSGGACSDVDGYFTGTVAGNGAFTGQVTLAQGANPVPMTGTFSLTAPFVLSGSDSVQSADLTCNKT